MDNHSQLMTTFPLFKGFTENGTRRLLESGEVNKHESVVLFNTGSGVKYMEAFTGDAD